MDVGENVGVGGDVGALVDACVASPLHDANLVHPDIRDVAIGVTVANRNLGPTHRVMALAASPTTTTSKGYTMPRSR